MSEPLTTSIGKSRPAMMGNPIGVAHVAILSMLSDFIERRSTILPTFMAFPSASFVISTAAIIIGTCVFSLIKNRRYGLGDDLPVG